VNEASELVARHVQTWTAERLQRGQVPAVVGGDHSVPLGAFRAATSAHPGLGVLHIDAHADLREAYEGFIQSHASIFFNALKMSGLARLVQVGLRDVGTQERALAAQDARVTWWTDDNIRRLLHDGATFRSIAERVVETLPEVVWVSFDIDGLDPSLCPATGTPVPGGLDWHQAMTLLEVLGRSGRRLIGFDLCEVGAEPWDANVAARLLYKLSGWALASRQELP
jgi:agmatinase